MSLDDCPITIVQACHVNCFDSWLNPLTTENGWLRPRYSEGFNRVVEQSGKQHTVFNTTVQCYQVSKVKSKSAEINHQSRGGFLILRLFSDLRYDQPTPGWLLPAALFTEAGMPHKGILTCTYASRPGGVGNDWVLRMALTQVILFRNIL